MTVDQVAPPHRMRILDDWDEYTGEWKVEGDDKPGPVTRLLYAMRNGASLHSAASYAKISYSTVVRWREAGRMFAADMDLSDRMELEIGERVFVDFVAQLEQVVGTFEVELASLVRSGCRDNPVLALNVLGRRYPHWREQKSVDVTSAGESLVQDHIAGLLTRDPRLATAGEAFALALEAAAEPGELEVDDTTEA